MVKPRVPQEEIDRGIYWSHSCTVVEGCTPVSEGCEHCWAAAMAHQYKRDFSEITVYLDRLGRKAKMKKPQVFSLWNDIFHEQLSTLQHNEIMFQIDCARQHTFLALTKRPSFIMPEIDFSSGERHPYPPNLWIGTSAENQELADIRIPELLDCKSPNLFVSLEPLLGPVDIGAYLPVLIPNTKIKLFSYRNDYTPHIKWCITGCETGPNRRPCDPEWIRSIVQQCQAADVPCFVKAINIDGRVLKDWDDPRFPDDLKVRQFPHRTAFEVDDAR